MFTIYKATMMVKRRLTYFTTMGGLPVIVDNRQFDHKTNRDVPYFIVVLIGPL